MKKLSLLFCIIFFIAPVFADEYDFAKDPNRDYPIWEYYTKLYNEYMEKVAKGEIDCSGHTFAKYVEIPTTEFKMQFDKEHNLQSFP